MLPARVSNLLKASSAKVAATKDIAMAYRGRLILDNPSAGRIINNAARDADSILDSWFQRKIIARGIIVYDPA